MVQNVLTQNRLTHISLCLWCEVVARYHASGRGFGIVLRSSASGSPARPCLGPAPRLRYFALAFFLRENRYAHPRARPWSALVRWTGSGTHGPAGLTTTHYGYPGAVQVARQTPPRTGAQPWRGPGCWAQSPKPKARSEAPMHPSPPNFNAGTRGHGKRNNRAFPLFQTKKHLVDALKTKLGNSFGGIECVLAL